VSSVCSRAGNDAELGPEEAAARRGRREVLDPMHVAGVAPQGDLVLAALELLDDVALARADAAVRPEVGDGRREEAEPEGVGAAAAQEVRADAAAD
jgi:hypothetical protein